MKIKKSIGVVILAGGFGTRLSPLTDTKPKPLVKILDTPVLSAILADIEKLLPESITVSTHYKAEMIEKLVSDVCPEAICIKESVPLGTAGAVKYCCDGKTDTVVVVSGDGVFDFDLREAVSFHIRNNNDVTIVGCRKNDPTNYGVMVCDGQGNILSFCEKPSWKRVKSDLVNTGIYVLSSAVIDEIPDSIQYDFSNNLFPKLLKEGKKIQAFVPDGYWCDIGSFDEYFECNRLAAGSKLGKRFGKGEDEKKLRDRGIHTENGCYVSPGANVGKNVRISGGSVVCENVHIGNNCDFSSVIVGENCRIGSGSSISRSVIGENVCIGENCIVPEGCVIGDGCRISDGTIMKKNTRLASQKCVFGEDNKMSEFSSGANLFVDDGLCLFDVSSSQENMFCFARSVALFCVKREKVSPYICVVSDTSAAALKGTFISGLMREGAYVFDCGNGNEALCEYGTLKLDAAISVHLKLCDNKVHVTVISEDGNPIDDEAERKIGKIYSLLQEGREKLQPAFSGNVSLVPLEEMYQSSVCAFAEKVLGTFDFDGIKVSVQNKTSFDEILSRLLYRFGATVLDETDSDTVSITRSKDGRKVSIRYQNTVSDYNHISAIILKNKEVLDLETIGICHDAPSALLHFAGENNKCSSYPESFVLKDSVMTVLCLLAVCSKSKKNVKELYEELPPFEVYTDEYLADVNKGATVERLSRLYHDSNNNSGSGIRLSLADGNVTVIPNRAKGFKIISEAVSMEAARELSLKIGQIIKGKE